MLSRLVTPKEAAETKKGLEDGSVEIVIGTHALLSKDIKFCNLGLLIIDEEQHFGVAHKEKLKALKSNVHVLTLTATPIPRTLQMSLTGVKQLSIIATPPVDRLAARTFVMPFDKVMIKEAIYREKFRNGQVFFVCPRVSDIFGMEKELRALVPDIRILVAHGQMPVKQLEDVMNDFADGKADMLLSTTIIESGIDMPTVNTMIVHRSDMFGLAQLYQLKGRVGRSKVRGYCYFTVPKQKELKPVAERRLNILQALDTLGAGFRWPATIWISGVPEISSAKNSPDISKTSASRCISICWKRKLCGRRAVNGSAGKTNRPIGHRRLLPVFRL